MAEDDPHEFYIGVVKTIVEEIKRTEKGQSSVFDQYTQEELRALHQEFRKVEKAFEGYRLRQQEEEDESEWFTRSQKLHERYDDLKLTPVFSAMDAVERLVEMGMPVDSKTAGTIAKRFINTEQEDVTMDDVMTWYRQVPQLKLVEPNPSTDLSPNKPKP